MVKRKISEKENAETEQFYEYLNKFYGPNGTYKGVLPGLTKKEVFSAIEWLKSKRAYTVHWSGGDSTDRERARDFILLSRKKTPQGYILSADKFEYGLQDILLHYRWRIISPEEYAQLEKLKTKKLKSAIPEISFDEIGGSYKDGLVFLRCGGDIQEWKEYILASLEDAKLVDKSLYDEDDWKLLKTTGGRTDLFFNIFKEGSKGDIGRLAGWRLTFGDVSWLSDYVVNFADHHDPDQAPSPLRTKNYIEMPDIA